MGEVILIDTSILCVLLRVPTFDGDVRALLAEQRRLIEQRVTMLLPFAVLIETGNHIAHHGDGNQRRAVATVFSKIVLDAMDGVGPWTLATQPSPQAVRDWLHRFPDYAQAGAPKAKGIGLGDVSIIHEYERQCVLNPTRRVRIWSLDQHLSAYDRIP